MPASDQLCNEDYWGALTSDVLELIIQHLPRSDHPATRLACRDMQKLIAPMLRTIIIKDWDKVISTVSMFPAALLRASSYMQ
jgi:hypothetical protein